MRHIVTSLFIVLLLTGCSATFAVNEPTSAQAGESTGTQGETQAEATECTLANIPGACATEEILTTVVTYLTLFAELAGALVIAVGVLRALASFIPHLLSRESDEGEYKENIRLQLGKSLALALEFALAADILKTAVAPSFTIIAQLAAIIILRTALNYFLERELQEVERRRADMHLADDRRRPSPHDEPLSPRDNR